MKGSTLLTLTLVTFAITALYVALGQPDVASGYFYLNQISVDNDGPKQLTWINQVQRYLASLL
jgi:hypothetical protein